MGKFIYYGAVGSNGFVICRSYEKVLQCRKYLQKHFSQQGFQRLDDAEVWVISTYNSIVGAELADYSDINGFGTITFTRDLYEKRNRQRSVEKVITIRHQ